MNKAKSEKEIIALLSQTKSRDVGFEALIVLYREPLYWHIRRLVVSHEDAQDILQETLINAHRYIANFRGDSSLKTWLYRIATNETSRHFRRQRIDTQSYDEHSLLVNRFRSDNQIDFESLEAKLQRAILALPAKQRVVFNLRYYDEMSYEQIAEVTESSVATLKTNYHYAVNKIKEQMLNQME